MATFYSREPWPNPDAGESAVRLRRSETVGQDWSASFLDDAIDNTGFLTPMLLWESFTDENSGTLTMFVADKNYNAGDNIVVRSNTHMVIDEVDFNYPFDYTTPTSIAHLDTVWVPDPISTRLFVATTDHI